MDSAHLQSLPIEMQYEIISEAKLKSRETSYDRLQRMLERSRGTAEDFSKEQILGLVKRNQLTSRVMNFYKGPQDTSKHGLKTRRVAGQKGAEFALVKQHAGWAFEKKARKVIEEKSEPLSELSDKSTSAPAASVGVDEVVVLDSDEDEEFGEVDVSSLIASFRDEDSRFDDEITMVDELNLMEDVELQKLLMKQFDIDNEGSSSAEKIDLADIEEQISGSSFWDERNYAPESEPISELVKRFLDVEEKTHASSHKARKGCSPLSSSSSSFASLLASNKGAARSHVATSKTTSASPRKTLTFLEQLIHEAPSAFKSYFKDKDATISSLDIISTQELKGRLNKVLDELSCIEDHSTVIGVACTYYKLCVEKFLMLKETEDLRKEEEKIRRVPGGTPTKGTRPLVTIGGKLVTNVFDVEDEWDPNSKSLAGVRGVQLLQQPKSNLPDDDEDGLVLSRMKDMEEFVDVDTRMSRSVTPKRTSKTPVDYRVESEDEDGFLANFWVPEEQALDRKLIEGVINSEPISNPEHFANVIVMDREKEDFATQDVATPRRNLSAFEDAITISDAEDYHDEVEWIQAEIKEDAVGIPTTEEDHGGVKCMEAEKNDIVLPDIQDKQEDIEWVETLATENDVVIVDDEDDDAVIGWVEAPVKDNVPVVEDISDAFDIEGSGKEPEEQASIRGTSKETTLQDMEDDLLIRMAECREQEPASTLGQSLEVKSFQEEGYASDDDIEAQYAFEETIDNEDDTAIDVPEMPAPELNEYTQFVSGLANKDMATVRHDLTREMDDLREQQRKGLRDSDDLTQQMTEDTKELLQLFGLPFIVAPMEAESQCAFLLQHNLVDGIVTDDSDVFLFGGTKVYKNMFNQSKNVEFFLMSDLEREMKLDRASLVRLSYLLGSDYTEGLTGIGVVTAMEILKEWNTEGADAQADDDDLSNDKVDLAGLQQFRRWCEQVRQDIGKITPGIQVHKKKFRNLAMKLEIPVDFPDPHIASAYIRPTVDEDQDKFTWGFPDLDALRDYLGRRMNWSRGKVDEVLVPVIKEMNSGKNLGSQRTLEDFFGAATKTSAHNSKRLQKVFGQAALSSPSGSSSSASSSTQPAGKKRKPIATKKRGASRRKWGTRK